MNFLNKYKIENDFCVYLSQIFNNLCIIQNNVNLFIPEINIYTEINNLLFVNKILKTHVYFMFLNLTDIIVQDFITFSDRFTINYRLSSPLFIYSINLILQVDPYVVVPSIQNIFLNSSWAEREAWDMYGLHFKGHKNLWRLINDYGFSGYPLRKDFPLTGFVEVVYEGAKKRLTRTRVQLAQEWRKFEIIVSWYKNNL